MNEKAKKKCFVIMPITTPDYVKQYTGDSDHFQNVWEHLFKPAITDAGFKPIPPETTGSNSIPASIIKNLSECELVLCDMSILNPNVFFEFGIRTALNKPIVLVIDNLSQKPPFDTSTIKYYTYKSAIYHWNLNNDIPKLTKHIEETFKQDGQYNPLWKYFGVMQPGRFQQGGGKSDEKIDILIQKIALLKEQVSSLMPPSPLLPLLGGAQGASEPTYTPLQRALDKRYKEWKQQNILNKK
jgi:hypothetical protein